MDTTSASTKPKASAAALPPELWDQIVSYTSSARDLSHLSQANKALFKFVEEEGWSMFTRSRFPYATSSAATSWKSRARSLTTVSRAWDRRAYVVRNLEPGRVFSYPGGKKVDKWKKPTGQSMGFIPRLDAYEVESSDTAATDILAFSAGSQVVLRKQTRRLSNNRKTGENSTWSTYKPHSAREGSDDVVSLHLISHLGHSAPVQQEVIVGTANGDLQHISVPFKTGDSSVKTYFITHGAPVQSTSLLQQSSEKPLLAAALWQNKLSLYTVNASEPKIAPTTTLDFSSPENKYPFSNNSSCRVRTTTLLSNTHLAVGVGHSKSPLRICTITPTGFNPAAVRRFQLCPDGNVINRTSVTKIIPFAQNKQTFLTGAYDGTVRLHDLRAPEDVQACYSMPHSDNAIYSLLLRGEHTLLAGTSRDDTVHVFDVRQSTGRYCYLDALTKKPSQQASRAYTLFLQTTSERRTRGGSSTYSLVASSPHSPYVYAGLENTVLEIAATEVLHPHPDLLYFQPWIGLKDDVTRQHDWNGWNRNSIKNVSLYDEEGQLRRQMPLSVASSPTQKNSVQEQDDRLDIRWRQDERRAWGAVTHR